MPVIKSAIKKQRQDKKRETANDVFRKSLARAIKAAKLKKDSKSIQEATSLLDKAAKKHIIHRNKAAHIKSSLSKLASAKFEAKTEIITKKRSAKKPAIKSVGRKSAKKTK